MKKNISHVTLYQWTKFHCLIAFTSWEITQCVYCNFLIPSWWSHKFWNWSIRFLTQPKKSAQKLKYLKNEKNFQYFHEAFIETRKNNISGRQAYDFNEKNFCFCSLSYTLQSALDVNVKRNYVEVSIYLVWSFVTINIITFTQSQEKKITIWIVHRCPSN